ncbi:MAG: hypothetical protein CBD95_005160 [Flavobacteriales bacterium TMED235]|nr:MAG: hypothetical protein CBD95_005160 [Flavobacteriales bacterium TMED235]
MRLTYLNLLNSRNDEDESDEILLSYDEERSRGILIGSGFLTLSFLILLSIIFKGFYLDFRKRMYVNDVFTYDETVLKIQKLKKEYKNIEKDNDKIIKSILALRSNLDIMNILKKIIPRDLYLDSLKISGNKVIFDGYVNNSLGVKIINAFILELIKSPLFDSDSVKLMDIKYKDSSDSFNFLINAIFVEDMSNLNLENIAIKNNKGFFQKLIIMKENKLFDTKKLSL